MNDLKHYLGYYPDALQLPKAWKMLRDAYYVERIKFYDGGQYIEESKEEITREIWRDSFEQSLYTPKDTAVHLEVVPSHIVISNCFTEFEPGLVVYTSFNRVIQVCANLRFQTDETSELINDTCELIIV